MKTVIMIVLPILIGVGLLIYAAVKHDKEFVKEKMADVVGCEVIGDAIYRNKSGWREQTIYKCPDGKLRIR